VLSRDKDNISLSIRREQKGRKYLRRARLGRGYTSSTEGIVKVKSDKYKTQLFLRGFGWMLDGRPEGLNRNGLTKTARFTEDLFTKPDAPERIKPWSRGKFL